MAFSRIANCLSGSPFSLYVLANSKYASPNSGYFEMVAFNEVMASVRITSYNVCYTKLLRCCAKLIFIFHNEEIGGLSSFLSIGGNFCGFCAYFYIPKN